MTHHGGASRQIEAVEYIAQARKCPLISLRQAGFHASTKPPSLVSLDRDGCID